MTKNILLTHLNNDKKVFVDCYNHTVLIEITKENIEQFDLVDLSDEMLELTTQTKEDKIAYHSQPHYYNMTVDKVNKAHQHNFNVVNMLKQYNECEIYYVDCEADVFIVS